MRLLALRYLSAFLFASLCGSAVWAGSKPGQEELEWTNPLVPQRADPHVFLHGGAYYLVATVPEYDRLELRRASSIAGLASAEAKVFWRPPAEGPASGVLWAPEIHFIDGRWYVYFSGGVAHQPWDRIRLHVLECEGDNPLVDKWTYRGQIDTGWESFTLDPTTFEHGGRRYLVWTQVQPGVQGTNIYIAELANPWTLQGKAVLLSRPDFEWEKKKYWVDEAPAVLIRQGRVFLTFSASATDANYCLGLLTAPAEGSLLDASLWKKSPEPVFKSNEATSQFGPGHNSFTTTIDGKTDILVYHSRNYKEIPGDSLADPNRATRAQVLDWNPDGTPHFGVPVADGPYAPRPRKP